MSKTADIYTEGEIGAVRPVADFLPRPEDLVLRDDAVKVTLGLSRHSVDFFKVAARKSGVPYQRMIRALLDEYVKGQERV